MPTLQALTLLKRFQPDNILRAALIRRGSCPQPRPQTRLLKPEQNQG
jgi:hypothetical protein